MVVTSPSHDSLNRSLSRRGDEVICGGYIDYILKDHENNKTLIVVFKDQIYAIVRDEQEEIGLFNQEMAAQEPQFIQG
jgi:hypothetical protein